MKTDSTKLNEIAGLAKEAAGHFDSATVIVDDWVEEEPSMEEVCNALNALRKGRISLREARDGLSRMIAEIEQPTIESAVQQ